MAKTEIICPQCETVSEKDNGAIARARKIGAPIYCSRACAGIARRKGKTPEEKVAHKAEYDRQYRIKNKAMLKAKKAARHKATYDPEKAREHRKTRMAAHVEYCRRPEYVKWKAEYDKKYRAKKQYGPFYQSFIILTDLEREILSRQSRYELDLQCGKLNKKNKRKVNDGRKTNCDQFEKHALGHA